MSKRIFLYLIIAAMALPLTASAIVEKMTDASGQWKYVLKDGGAVITGYADGEPTGDLVIPSEVDGHTVTGIGARAFLYCPRLASVTIPGSVTVIGDSAFARCSSLSSVTILDGVASIGTTAFESCALTSLTIPDSVTSIGPYAFGGNDALPDSIIKAIAARQDAPTYIFEYELVDGGAVITKSPLILGCWEEPGVELWIPSELDGYPVMGISAEAFDECDLMGIVVYIPASVTSIGEYAFVNYGGCYWVTLGVTKGSAAEHYARDNGIEHFVIDASGQWKYVVFDVSRRWEDIFEANYEDYSFAASGQVEDAYVDEGATIVGFTEAPSGDLVIPSEVDGYPVAGIRNLVYECSDGDEPTFSRYPALTGVIIPDGVTTIGFGAFWECANLTDVTIPDSVTHIDEYAFWRCGITSMTIPAGVIRIGDNPFVGCALKRFDVSPDNPIYEQIDGVLFDKQQKMLVSYPSAREGPYAIPEGVTSIGGFAFYECEGLTSVTIPGSVTDIGWEPFEGCADVVLSVEKESFAEEYAKDNGIAYIYSE